MHFIPKQTFRLLIFLQKILLFSLLMLLPSYAEIRLAPIAVGDILTFVPYSEVNVDLGQDTILGEDQVKVIVPSIVHQEEVAHYQWSEGSKVLSTEATFSTASLSLGTHILTLTLTDKNGLKSSDSIVITIEDPIDEYDLSEDERFVGTTKGDFSVSQGTAHYDLKIDLPPGIAGMEPKLSLHYSSNGANGDLGLGWSLAGVSAITRCPQSRAVEGDSHTFGVNYDSHDRFCLDGQRLIAIEGEYGEDGTEYRTEIDSYSKIVSKGTYHGGPRHFVVQSKSGLTSIYGLSQDTYVHTQPGHALKAWKIDTIQDSYDNTITFHYDADYTQGIHRLSHVNYADNEITFTYEDRPDVLSGFHAGFPFKIDKRLKEVLVTQASSEVRHYALRYQNDETGRKQSQLSSIQEFVKEGSLSKLYVVWQASGVYAPFPYATAIETDILANGEDAYGDNDEDNKWYIYTPDINGDGHSDLCYRADSGIKCFLSHDGEFANTPEIDTSICSNGSTEDGTCNDRDNYQTIRFVDMDADGLQDLLYRSDEGIRIWKSTGSGFGTLHTNNILRNHSASSSEDNWQYLFTPDVNGDGLADLCYRQDTGMACYQNKGEAEFSDTPTFTTSICANDSTEDGTCDGEDNYKTIRFVDMDADGLQDLLYRSDKGMRIWKSTGSGFGSTPSHESTLIANKEDETKVGGILRDEWKYIYTPDLNGDGLPDLCYRSYEGITCYSNVGGAFNETAIIETNICANDSTDDGTCNDEDNYKTIRFVDTDADGLQDLTYRSDEGMRIWKSTGSGFSDSPLTSSILANYEDDFGNNDYDNWSTKSYFDANGDGIQDLYYRSDSGIIVYQNSKAYPLVSRFLNGQNQEIAISYQPMTNPEVYHNYALNGHRNAYAFNDIANGNIELSLPMPLVSKVQSDNGVGGLNQVRYKYYGYIINTLRGAQGFHAINLFDDTAKMYTTTYYKQIGVTYGEEDTQGFAFTGMPYLIKSNRLYGDGTPLSETRIAYKEASNKEKVYAPYNYKTTQTHYDPTSHTLLQTDTKTQTLSSDGLGNITQIIETTDDHIHDISRQKRTQMVYDAEDTNKWYIGRLTKATLTQSRTGESDQTTVSRFGYNAHGLLNLEVSHDESDLALSKTYTYDTHGNKATESVSGKEITTATTTYGYDSLGKFQTSIIDAAGYRIAKTYDARFGTVASLTDTNGLRTSWEYDGLGRKVKERRPDGGTTVWKHTYASNYILAPYALYSVSVATRGAPFKRTYYDSLGREVGNYTYAMKKGSRQSYKERRIVTRRFYNAKGELYKEELPHYQESTPAIIERDYDAFGRTQSVRKTGANDTVQTYSHSYSNFTHTLTKPNGAKKHTHKNAFGEIDSIDDGATIEYHYDAAGNLLSTTNAAGNSITMSYDTLGNKIAMHDPDLGEWHYTYNALGALTRQWSGTEGYSKSPHASYVRYDILGRKSQEGSYNHLEYNEESDNYSYHQTYFHYADPLATQGSRGKPTLQIARSHMKDQEKKEQTRRFEYDTQGRLIRSTTNIVGRGEYTTQATYDHHSRPSRTTYPNGYYVTKRYKNGLVDAIIGKEGKVHYEVGERNAFGAVSSGVYANHVADFRGYDAAGYLGTIVSGLERAYLGDVQRLDYSYDTMGNVLTREDNSIEGKYIRERFSYDTMERLRSMELESDVEGSYLTEKRYDYDALGNLTFQTGIGDYSYYTDKPHALKSAGERSYLYDSVGNTLNRNGDTLTYTPFNKPATLQDHNTSQRVTFTYGIGKVRYAKENSLGQYTYYIGKAYEEQVEDNTEKQICYIMLGGKSIGTHIEVKDTDYVSSNPNYNEASYNRYFHTDALGSISAITNDAGEVVERRSYTPFGKIRAMDYGTNHNTLANTLTQTTRAYTGHEQIVELSGLVHMNARVYDSDIGRFLSADTLIQDPHDSQSYNRYAYVRNNPLKYSDPTGNSWWTKFRDKWVKPLVSVVLSAIIIAGSGGLGILGGVLGNLGVAGGAALAGAVSGGIMSGSWQGAYKGALFALFSAGIAQGIGNGFEATFGLEHGATLFSSAKVGAQTLRALSHGLSRGVISIAQGGTFKSGFASGFASSLFSPGTSIGGNGAGGFTLRTTIASIVGGTASSLGGGKFSNGAVSGAFVHMFNAENILNKLTFAQARAHYIENSGKQISVLASSVDLSKVNRNIFSGIGDTQLVQLFFHGEAYSSFNDALTYGGITLVYVGGNQVGIKPDYYNFEMKDWSTSTIRNLGTIGGRILNMDPLGTASGYTINFVGTATIGGNQ